MANPAMVYTIDIGKEDLFSSNSELLLTLRASVQVLPPPDDQIHRDQKVLQGALIAREVWVDQPAELKLDLRISADQTLSYSLSTFVSVVGKTLCRSKAWLELGLVPLFESCDTHTVRASSTEFQLRFGLRKSLQSHLPRRASRLPAAIRKVPSDSCPPPGISVVHLSALHVSLEYRRLRPLPLPHLVFPVCERTALYTGLRHDLSDTLALIHHTQSRKEEAFSQSAWGDSFARRQSSFIDELCHIDDGMIHNAKTLKGLPTALPLDEPTVQIGELHSLFTRGFKTLLAGSSDQEPIGTGSPQSLSQIAPQIFSLGYREAMNHRVQFIPSISRSIASILKTADNASLRDKITLLGGHDATSGTDLPETKWEAQRLTMQRSLWRIAQKQLYKPGSSRNLCLLDSIPGGTVTSDDILFSESGSDREPHGDDGRDSLEYYFGADDEAQIFDWMDDEDSIICMKEDISEYSDEILCHSEFEGNTSGNITPFVLEHQELFISMHDPMISRLGSEDILQPLSDGLSNGSLEDMLCDET